MVLGFPSLYELMLKIRVWTAGGEVLASRALVRGWVLGQCAPAWWELAEANDPKPPCPALFCVSHQRSGQLSAVAPGEGADFRWEPVPAVKLRAMGEGISSLGRYFGAKGLF